MGLENVFITVPSSKRHRKIVARDLQSWREVFRKLYEEACKTGKLNPEIVVPADNLPNPSNANTMNFNRADVMSLNKGAEKVYRDSRTDDSLQVRVYNDGVVGIENTQYEQDMYHIQLDGHNPKKGFDEAIAHLFHDVFKIKVPAFHPNEDEQC